ncbi:glycerate kinase [Lapidilactobacillus salsurivasis]
MKKNKIIIAMDSFKGSATSLELGNWLAEGILQVDPDLETIVLPIADGGEGTLESLQTVSQGKLVPVQVHGPLGDLIQADYCLLDPKTAVIEMALASGLALTNQTETDALNASTFGVGELIIDALDQGATKIYLGIGGSATTDGGAGMAQALGAKLLDQAGQPIAPGAAGLPTLAHIDMTHLDPRLKKTQIKVLSDVTNLLLGKAGAAAVYGAQKGIPLSKLDQVDQWLAHYSRIIERDLGIEVAQLTGSGAAGGLGAGLLAFTNATMVQGIQEILNLWNFDALVGQAQLVITGEGKIDNQSVNGKAPIGIAQRAKQQHVPVVAIVGGRATDLSEIYRAGIDLVLPIIPRPMTLAQALDDVHVNTVIAGETAIRAFQLGSKKGDQE